MSDIKELIASKLRPIGDAIREKNGSTELIPIDDMPQAIRDIQGGGGGIVEVTELPSEGKANTVYKLIHKNVGTEVPQNGYVEKVYFNTNLSVEETDAILETLDFSNYGYMYHIFVYDNGNTAGYPCLIVISATIASQGTVKGYGIGILSADDTQIEVIYTSNETCLSLLSQAGVTITNNPKVGWNMSEMAVGYRVFDSGSGATHNNYKISNVVSVTPFEEKIPSEMYYLYKENEWVQISGGILEVDKLPTSGEDNYVYALKKQPTYDVYVNEKEQGISNLTELAKQSGGKVEVVAVVNILPTENIIVSPSDREMNLYYIKNDGLYVYADSTGDGNVTWHNFADAMVLSFSGEVTSESDMTVTDSLYLLSSGGDSADYYIYEKGEPTQVPNSGLIENLYFNTKLSIEETDAILSQLTFSDDGDYIIMIYQNVDETYGSIGILEANETTQGQITSGYMIFSLPNASSGVSSMEVIYTSSEDIVAFAESVGLSATVGWNKDNLSVSQEAIDDGNGLENDKLINVVSTTPYPHWNKISGSATVKATPEVVPNTGFVERIYLNKSLSFDEVNALVEKANGFVANELVPIYGVVSNNTFDKQLTIMKLTDHDDTNFNSIHYPTFGNVIWSERDYYNEETDGSITQFKKGWMFEEDYVEINSEVVSFIEGDVAVNVGQHNDQLTELFSINNVFETNEIKVSGDYDGSPLVLSNKYVKKTVVPNEGYVERVYFNTSLSVNEVDKELDKLGLDFNDLNNNGYYWLITEGDTLYLSAIVKTEKGYILGTISYGLQYTVIYSTTEDAYANWIPTKSGWQGIDYIEVNRNVNSGEDLGMVVDKNDLLVNVLSLTPFEEKIYDSVEVDVKSLLEEKKLPLEIKVNVESESVNVVKSGGTVVPNSGTISEIYFNTNLSVEEVKSILDTLTFIDIGGGMGMYVGLQGSNNANNFLSIMKNNGNYFIMFEAYEGSFVFASAIDETLGTTFAGWIDGFNGVIEVNDTLSTEMDGMTIGAENDKLTDLISATPFENKVIKKLSGDYEAVDLEFNELPSVWKGKEIPNDEYIENIYFNTKLSIEEVDNILDRIDYTDNIYGIALVQESENTYLPLYVERGEKYGLSGYAIRYTASLFIFVSNQEIVDFISDNLGVTTKVGWNIENSLLSVYRDVVPSYQDNTYGTQNDKLSSLVSVSEFILDNTIDLEQYLDNKQMPLSIKVNVESESVNVVKSGGTVVPNNAYIENVYFNTNLSVEEVVNILEQLTYNETNRDYVLVTNEGDEYLTLYCQYTNNIYSIHIRMKRNGVKENSVLFTSVDNNNGFTGWNPNITYPIVVNDTAEPMDIEEGDLHGTQNDKLTQLFSITMFGNQVIKTLKGDYQAVDIVVTENKTVDVEKYLDNMQMPLSIKVNVESQEPNLQEKEITENGEYVADEGYDGFSKVTVNVASGGGEDRLKKLLDTTQSAMQLFNNYQGKSVDDLIKYDDTENVTNMENMFMNCKNLTKIPQLNTSKVTSMQYMFYQCTALTAIPQLDTSEVTNMKQMFYYCNTLKTIPQLNTSKVSNMQNMFSSCQALETIPQLNTSKVTSMQYMFYQCTALTAIPQLDMIKVSNAGSMFNQCSKLTNLTLLNIKANLDLSQSEKLTLDSLINTVKELINVGSARTLTMGTANLSKIASTYVKFTDSSVTSIPKNEKGDVVVCESTDTGAMLLKDYALLKNWTLA